MEKRILVGGRWIDSAETFDVVSPFSGEHLAKVFTADKRISNESITSAGKGAAKIGRLPRFEIARGLRRIADGIESRREDFARTIARESAKPMVYARGEVERGIATFAWAAGEAERFTGEIVPVDTQPGGRGKTAYTVHRPRGVIYGITPFNFPLNLVAHKVAPALASGNAIIIKPSPRTPLTALMLGEVFLESGLPPEAFQVVPLDVRLLDDVFNDDRVAMISFTGSAAVGWEIKSRIGKKALALELGGNAAVIVDETADRDAALSKIVTGAFAYSGQVCISVQRLYLHESIFDEYTARLVDEAANVKTGDPLGDDTRFSVMIDEAAAERAEAWIGESTANGAQVLCGGKREGALLEPTLISGTHPEMRVVSEEAFAPLMVVEKFSDMADAVGQANIGKYGLQAGVFSKNTDAVSLAVRELDYGGVIVNDVPTFRVDNMPYGGVKDSGFGREGVRYAMEEMCERKLIVYSLK
ncbi:MAG: aldehyde dehydrogenase family protein [Acidobacteriota bacterium]